MGAPYRYTFVFRDPLDRTSLPLAELAAVMWRLHGPIAITYGQPNDVKETTPLKASDFGCSEAMIIPWAQSAVVLSTVPLLVPDIVARSGYLHSGGALVYCSAWSEADADKVIGECKLYLQSKDNSAAKLVWYTRTYVDSHKRGDGPARADLHPLGPLEIDEKRYHLGDRPFKEEAERVVQALPRGGKQALLYAYRDVTHDGATHSSYLRYRERSSQDWLIIYETLAKKENPVHDLDDLEERKLFWAGIFTTPHRLINAMLNLCDVGAGSLVVDPFAHTGTVAIEAAQLGATTRSFDLSEVRGAQDNFKFFCSPNPGEDLSSIEESLKDADLTAKLTELAVEHSNVNHLGLPDIGEPDRIETLMAGSFGALLAERKNRLLYWLLRRSILQAKRNHASAQASAYATGLIADLRPHLRRLDNLSGPPLHESPYPAGTLCSVSGAKVRSDVFPDDFEDQSPRTFLSYRVMNMEAHTFALNNITMGLSAVPDASVDAVVTDPPYGYGDEIPYPELRKIWVNFIRESLRVLRDGGAMAFCALDKVKTGRPEKQLLTTDEIIHLLNAAAARHRRHFAFPSIDPFATQSHGVFYWKSTRALNRSIVAVRVYRAPGRVG